MLFHLPSSIHYLTAGSCAPSQLLLKTWEASGQARNALWGKSPFHPGGPNPYQAAFQCQTPPACKMKSSLTPRAFTPSKAPTNKLLFTSSCCFSASRSHTSSPVM